MSGQANRAPDLYRVVSTDIKKVTGVEPEPAIRLYSTQFTTEWTLQVRGTMRLANMRFGKDYVVSSSSLRREDMIALRDSIDAMLCEGRGAEDNTNAPTMKEMLAGLEFVDGDDLSLSGCRFCPAMGPDLNPAHPKAPDPHDVSCPLAAAIGAPTGGQVLP